jgi:hypothetical protein
MEGPLVNSSSITNLQKKGKGADTTFVVDLAVESIFNYQKDSASTVLVSGRPLVNGRALVNGSLW